MKWSYSSHSALRKCQRLFAFSHRVASHAARDPVRREAYILKQLQHVATWQGSLVHHVLATEFVPALRARCAIDAETLSASARSLAERQFAFSATKRYRAFGETKSGAGPDYCALFEHEFDAVIDAETPSRVADDAAVSFKNLMSQTEFLRELRAGRDHTAEVPLMFRLDGVTIAATPDLLFRLVSGKMAIVDWKIGRSETSDYRMQLVVYALATARSGRWPGLSPDDVELYEVNLLQNCVRRHPVDSARLESAADFVYRSLMDLRRLGADAAYGDMDLSAFDVAGRPTTCQYCNFRKLCTETLIAEGRPEEAEAVQGRLW